MKTKRKQKNEWVSPLDDLPKSVETFRAYEATKILNASRDDIPYCFNGVVAVVKYRITVERVNEPIKVIHERLQKLWDECDNHHHWQPLEAVAGKFKYKFPNSAGSKVKTP